MRVDERCLLCLMANVRFWGHSGRSNVSFHGCRRSGGGRFLSIALQHICTVQRICPKGSERQKPTQSAHWRTNTSTSAFSWERMVKQGNAQTSAVEVGKIRSDQDDKRWKRLVNNPGLQGKGLLSFLYFLPRGPQGRPAGSQAISSPLTSKKGARGGTFSQNSLLKN